MVPLVDIGFYKLVTTRIREVLPNLTTSWSLREYARQSLAVSDKQKSIGLPGISIYRVNSELETNRYTMGQVVTGEPIEKNIELHKEYLLRVMPVILHYEVVGYTKTIDERNDMERELWYNDVITVVECHAKYSDEFPEVDYDFAVWGEQNVEYNHVNSDKTGKILFYEVSRTFRVYGQWVKYGGQDLIKELSIKFYNDPESVMEHIITVPQYKQHSFSA
jgi:hypothetical protein